jgi:hypothetical protein
VRPKKKSSAPQAAEPPAAVDGGQGLLDEAAKAAMLEYKLAVEEHEQRKWKVSALLEKVVATAAAAGVGEQDLSRQLDEEDLPEPTMEEEPTAADGRYVPELIAVPKVAKTKGNSGRPKMQMPAWALRQRMRYPPEAMRKAVELALPEGWTPENSEKWSDAELAEHLGERGFLLQICTDVNAEYSNAIDFDPPLECRLDKRAVVTAVEIEVSGAEATGPGVKPLISQEIVETWVGWCSLQGEDKRSPVLQQALFQLWVLCEKAEVDVPVSWRLDPWRLDTGRALSAVFMCVNTHGLCAPNALQRPVHARF